jgi:hypothetical protein
MTADEERAFTLAFIHQVVIDYAQLDVEAEHGLFGVMAEAFDALADDLRAGRHVAQPREGASMRLVILESPYAGEVRRNVSYARRCLRDALRRGEAPIASHLLYTQEGVLDDLAPDERRLGIDAGLAWLRVAEASVVYQDHGISRGMQHGIDAARAAGIPVEFRSLVAEHQEAAHGGASRA